MKIICKCKDFYDYFQGIYIDDTIVFDRRNCIIITEDDFLNWINDFKYNYRKIFVDKLDPIYLLLQIGYTNWLIKIVIKDINQNCGNNDITDYTIELIEKWKDYNHCYKCRFGKVKSHHTIEQITSKKFDIHSTLLNDIKHNNYKLRVFNDSYNYCPNFDTIPIFSKTKIPSVVDAFEVYQSFEEYFSHLKDDVNCDNMTDKEKIESHGFDKDYSFRNKK